MKRRGTHWAQINEVSFVGGMRLLFAIYRIFGRWPFRLMLYPVIAWYVLAKPSARQASLDFLRQLGRYRNASAGHAAIASIGAKAGGGIGVRGDWFGVMRHFASFGESILDKMMVWGGLFDMASIRQNGRQLLEQDVAAGRGGLLICTHLGNLELCRVVSLQSAAMKLTVLVHTKHARAFNKMLAQLAPDSTLNLMQVTEMSPATAIDLSERVARGEFVVIAGDRIPVSPRPRVSFAPFLGRNAPFPVGPYVLASLLQCRVYLMFSRRTRDGAELDFEHFRDRIVLPRNAREAAFDTLTAAYAQRLQHHCLRAPLQWFNFYDFWHLPAAAADLASPKADHESS
ncbi:acyltransferase [Oxalobacteraceae bacterium CAVE-383]|nr:acyltransferase [Oxalobacteraceae bacterium CAVE-383]